MRQGMRRFTWGQQAAVQDTPTPMCSSCPAPSLGVSEYLQELRPESPVGPTVEGCQASIASDSPQ